jgi:hypothetical protein
MDAACPRCADLGQTEEIPALTTIAAWQARFSRRWRNVLTSQIITARTGAQAGQAVRLSDAQLRVLIALETYREVGLPGQPRPAELARVARVTEATRDRALATLRAHGLLP